MEKETIKREIIKRDIDIRVRAINLLAKEIRDTLENLDTETVDSLGLYEYEAATPFHRCTRYEFFRGFNMMDLLRNYFDDEAWAFWETYRDDNRKETK